MEAPVGMGMVKGCRGPLAHSATTLVCFFLSSRWVQARMAPWEAWAAWSRTT